MVDYLIVAVNLEKARFFALKPAEFPELESSPRMVEYDALINPVAMTDAHLIYTDSKTGRGTAPSGGPVHGYDDKRDRHVDELRRRFADLILLRIKELSTSNDARRIVFIPSARMRQFLNPGLNALKQQGFMINKVSKNMINFSPQKIHAHLAKEGLVPAQRRMANT
jgi:hypothetical protein